MAPRCSLSSRRVTLRNLKTNSNNSNNNNNNNINKSIPRHAGDGLRNISLHMVFPGITVNLNNFIRNFLHGRPDKQDLKNLTKVDIQDLLTCAKKKITNYSKCHKAKAIEIVLENRDDIQTSLRLKVNGSDNASGEGAAARVREALAALCTTDVVLSPRTQHLVNVTFGGGGGSSGQGAPTNFTTASRTTNNNGNNNKIK